MPSGKYRGVRNGGTVVPPSPIPSFAFCGFSYPGSVWSKNTKFPPTIDVSAPDIQPLTSSWLDDPGLPEAGGPLSDKSSEGQ